MRSVWVLAWCQAGKTKVCPSNCWVSNNCLTVLSNWVRWTPWSSSLHVTEWHWMCGSQHRGKDSTLGCKGDWASTFRVEARRGQWRRLLVLTQAVPQKQSRLLTTAEPLGFPRWTQSYPYQDMSYLKWQKLKNFKYSKRKTESHTQANSYSAIPWFLCRNFAGQRRAALYFKVLKGKNLQPRILYSADYHLQQKERKRSSQTRKRSKNLSILNLP